MSAMTPEAFPVGTRVRGTNPGNRGVLGTVIAWTAGCVTVRFDHGGTDTGPGSHGGYVKHEADPAAPPAIKYERTPAHRAYVVWEVDNPVPVGQVKFWNAGQFPVQHKAYRCTSLDAEFNATEKVVYDWPSVEAFFLAAQTERVAA